MKHALPALSFLPILCLASSCGSFSGPRVLQNGDLYESNAASYADVTREVETEDLIARIKTGEPLLYFWYSASCSHCVELEPKLVPAILQYRYEVLSCSTGIYAQKSALIEAFPAFESVFGSYGTPSLYLIQGPESIARLPIAEKATSSSATSKYLQKTVQTYAVYDFRHVAPFLSFIRQNPCLILTDSGDERGASDWSSFFEEGKSATEAKPYAHLDLSEVSPEEKEALPDLFDITSSSAKFEADGQGNYTPLK